MTLLITGNLLYAQVNQDPVQPVRQGISLSGPRIGVTILADNYIKRIEQEYDMELKPVLAQFGWQFEERFFTVKSGATAVTEWIVLIGGFEQEKFLPSLSWLVGMRSAGGFEFGVGPNLAASGTSFVIATGVTLQSAEINFPINFALSVSKSGSRFTLLFGFNMRNL